jgi:type II secretory pathway pseudopilin PulG
MVMTFSPGFLRILLVVLTACFLSAAEHAQQGPEADPANALSAALGAACRANEAQFLDYLTAESAAAFRALPAEQRTALLRRFSLSEAAGKTLASSDAQGHIVLRCQSPEETVEFRFGDVRSRENLAFVPVKVTDSQQTEFGLVRESGRWRLLSLGLVLLDIPQLSKQWAAQDRVAQEDAAIATLRELGEAVRSYRRAFGKLPDSLNQLGPAPKDEISPDQASLISQQLAAGSSGGYRFRYRILPAETDAEAAFELAATPEEYGKTGQRSFFLDGAEKIHGADKHGTVAGPADPLISSEKAP